MASLRNQLRPKHQVLILKCYPKFQKNAAEVKPNSSELSYLLYYASTRRSKVQKVGAFLERKTESDVRRGKTGNVQVTLAILSALIDRTRRDLTLYAPYVLRIVKTVLASNKVGLVEDSVKTFQAFCEHQDVATFAADQGLVRMYEDIVRAYASFAQKTADGKKTPLSKPVSVRWRTAGLTAIESITKSDAIGVDGGIQLTTIVPVLLDNLYSESDNRLLELHAKLEDEDASDRDPAIKGRPSLATQRTNETLQTTDGTTEDADRIAEEEVGKLALQSLKQIFTTNSRGQIRAATQATLKFVLHAVSSAPAAAAKGILASSRPDTAKTSATTASMLVGSWSTAIVQMVTRWTPVQDRFVIMVTLMEELVKSPIAEENLGPQLILAITIDSLLSSSINMIGLSVMDVLLGLIQHILLILQLGGQGSNILPHHQQTDAIDLFGDADPTDAQDTPEPVAAIVEDAKDEKHPSTTRQRLLDRLRLCIGALANHIYYSDQIADIITALLLRLKPSPLSSVASPIAAIENPGAAAQAISASVKMQENPKTDAFFSFGTARVTALNAIREVLVVANSKASVTGAGAVGRNRVPVQTWEGTEWLLRDEDRRVRRAFVDALTTWLRYEMSKTDLNVLEDRQSRRSKVEAKTNTEPARAVSNASRRSKNASLPKSFFLQLLHLAIYENATETPEDESETLLLHLLLYTLVEKLGVNAVQHGLPMIMRLQEDINTLEAISSPKAKIVVGSLVHGYFWSLTDQFDFENTLVGNEIISEIERRKKHQLWLRAVSIAPVPLEKILVAGSANAIKDVDPGFAQTEVLRPFDSIIDLVNQIAVAYDNSIASPPGSPPGSPAQAYSSSLLATTLASSAVPSARARQLPDPIREAMLSRWTKAACIASTEQSITRSVSLHGSHRGTLRSTRNGYLVVETGDRRDSSPGSDGTPLPGAGGAGRRSLKQGLSSLKAPANNHQNGSLDAATSNLVVKRARSMGGSDTRLSVAGGGNLAAQGVGGAGVVRFGELKRMLDNENRGVGSDGGLSHKMAAATTARASVSVGSESLIDADGLSVSDDEATTAETSATAPAPASVASIATPTLTQQPTATVRSRRQSRGSGGGGSVPGTPSSPRPDSGGGTIGSTPGRNRTRTNSTASAEDPEANARALRGEIVPAVVHINHHYDGRGDDNDADSDPDAVPPVPPLPEGIVSKVSKVSLKRPVADNDFAPIKSPGIAVAPIPLAGPSSLRASSSAALMAASAAPTAASGGKRQSTAAKLLDDITLDDDVDGLSGGVDGRVGSSPKDTGHVGSRPPY